MKTHATLPKCRNLIFSGMHPKRFYRAFLLTLMVLGGSRPEPEGALPAA